MLNAVLEHHKPSEWEDASYVLNRYQLFDLDVGDDEYNKEINPFVNGNPRVDVKSLKRVQNPYQLGRFIIRKEQKQQRSEPVEVVKYYHPISTADLNTALEFNMDVRRYTHKYAAIMVQDKNPRFYPSPGAAFNAISHVPDKIILICNVLGGRRCSDYVSYEYKASDTEYMPIYVAALY